MKSFLIAALFLLPFLGHAESANIGFVQGIWYSSEPVFVGVPTRVYVAFRNNTPHDLTGTIRFTDNGTRIGSSPVSVLSGRIAEAWIDWIPTSGEHTLGATLSDAELHEIGKPSTSIDVAGIIAEDAVTVDYDTDGDGVGNATDEDDDGDGLSDADELAGGTDPLRANPRPADETSAEVTESAGEAPAEPGRTEAPRSGLEEYLGEGITSSIAESVTDTIHDVRESLDEYREKRNEALYAENSPAEPPVSETDGAATITRSKIETRGGFFDALLSGITALIKNLYTFALFMLSGALARPAFVELALLIFILYAFYRMARYFGNRPNW